MINISTKFNTKLNLIRPH